ncbi:MAG: hypothetical protein DCC75_08630 [Proteobacteria bacterium]|nr:MAG: hypothetical protein DCC75_08630 [Pseudomonadota bacterium]
MTEARKDTRKLLAWHLSCGAIGACIVLASSSAYTCNLFLLGFGFSLLGSLGYSAVFLSIVTKSWFHVLLAFAILTIKLAAIIYFFTSTISFGLYELFVAGLGYATVLPAAVIKGSMD